MGAAGGMISAGLQFDAGAMSMIAAKQGAAAYEYSGEILESEGDIAMRQGLSTATGIRSEGEDLQSTQKVAYAKSGVMLLGTPLQELEKTAQQTEREALLARETARLNQLRYLQQAEIQYLSAESIESSGKANQVSSIGSGIGDIFGGIGDLF